MMHKYRVTGTYYYEQECPHCHQPMLDDVEDECDVTVLIQGGLTGNELDRAILEAATEQLPEPGAYFDAENWADELEIEDLGPETPEAEMRRIHAPMLPGFAEVAS